MRTRGQETGGYLVVVRHRWPRAISIALAVNGIAAMTALIFIEGNSTARIAVALAAVVSWVAAFYLENGK